MIKPGAYERGDPLVSVCLPAYNAGRFIGKCIESLLCQSYGRIEVIVSDNASTDDTVDVVRNATDPRVQYFRNPENIGPFPNWNRCIERASGEFVAVYHADDVYDPEIVGEEVRFLQAHPDAGAVFAGALRIDPEDRVIGSMSLPAPLRGDRLFAFGETLAAILEHGNFLVCPTFMGRRSVLARAGRFREDRFGTAADAGMWFQILENARIGVIDRPLMRYRVGENQSTYRIERLRVESADHFKVMDHFLAHPMAAGAVSRRLLEGYETGRIVDETRCLRNLIVHGRLQDARELSRRIYFHGAARKYLRSRRRIRYLGKRIFYSLLLETGLGKAAGRFLSFYLKHDPKG